MIGQSRKGLASFHALFSHVSVISLCSRRSDKFALSQLFSHNIGSIIGVAISSVNLVSFRIITVSISTLRPCRSVVFLIQ